MPRQKLIYSIPVRDAIGWIPARPNFRYTQPRSWGFTPGLAHVEGRAQLRRMCDNAEPKLTKAQEVEVKAIARRLLGKLKREKLILDWRLKENVFHKFNCWPARVVQRMG
jgi:hypothetical protein